MDRIMTLCASLLIALVALGFAAPVQADDALDRLRANGEIIERFDGYVEAAPSASAEAKAKVAEVNAKRQALYQQRAAQNNAPVSEVGKVFALEIIKQAPAGTYFRNADGSLTRK